MNTTSFTRWTYWTMASGTRLAGILIAAFLLIRLVHSLSRRMVRAATTPTRAAQMREQQMRTLAGLLSSVGTAVIIIVAVLTALPEFGVNVTPISGLAALASLALGFGAQNLVKDWIGGIVIVIEDQYVVGDLVRIGETLGRVEHLTLRRTVLRDLQGALVHVSNGDVRQAANLSRDWSQLFLDVTLPPEEPVDRALTALERVAGEFRGDAAWSPALVDGPRVLGVEAVTLAGSTLRLQVRTAPTRQHDVARELRRRIRARFEQEHIPCVGVQRTEMVGAPAVKTTT
ncbi:MAG: mechanosensitive ion channel family protein [Acidipila sp.]|nr:mechanosensitive ion channel family protein [Acidipila sp.]